jgi:hypothetical protein
MPDDILAAADAALWRGLVDMVVWATTTSVEVIGFAAFFAFVVACISEWRPR